LSEGEATNLAKGGGEINKWLILSYFKDVYQALNIELRTEVGILVKKKENLDKVWFTLLALYVYSKKLPEFGKGVSNLLFIFVR